MRRMIYLLIATLFVLVPIYAVADDGGSGHVDESYTVNQSLDDSVTIRVNNETDIKYKTEMEREFEIELGVEQEDFRVEGFSTASVDDKQILKFNKFETEEGVSNDTSIDDETLGDAQGNIGVNMATGDGNMQDNMTAIATTEQENSLADASVYKLQKSIGNDTKTEEEVTNTVRIGDEALEHASGNIGLNLASGSGNGQSNMLAISLGKKSRVGTASAGANQESAYNKFESEECVHNSVSLTGDALEHASGNIGVNLAAGSGNLQANGLAVTALFSYQGGGDD